MLFLQTITKNIVAKKTTELLLFFHKKRTKLVFLWLNMGQKSIKLSVFKFKLQHKLLHLFGGEEINILSCKMFLNFWFSISICYGQHELFINLFLFVKLFLCVSIINLTHEFLYENFNKKFFLKFLLKLTCNNSCDKFNAF